jgi:hypothetical protein
MQHTAAHPSASCGHLSLQHYHPCSNQQPTTITMPSTPGHPLLSRQVTPTCQALPMPSRTAEQSRQGPLTTRNHPATSDCMTNYSSLKGRGHSCTQHIELLLHPQQQLTPLFHNGNANLPYSTFLTMPGNKQQQDTTMQCTYTKPKQCLTTRASHSKTAADGYKKR